MNHRTPNHNGLRVVRTARSEEDINKAAKEGFWPLLKEVKQGPDIQASVTVFQDQVTGEVEVASDLRFNHRLRSKIQVLPWLRYYPYYFPEPYAAYLIPIDLVAGERVWLEDIIEDIVAEWGNQGFNPRLKAWEATWNGSDFTIHFDPEKDAPVLIG